MTFEGVYSKNLTALKQEGFCYVTSYVSYTYTAKELSKRNLNNEPNTPRLYRNKFTTRDKMLMVMNFMSVSPTTKDCPLNKS